MKITITGRLLLQLIALVALFPGFIKADPLPSYDYTFCEIMYSRADILGAGQNAKITITPTASLPTGKLLSVLVFEWRDRKYIGETSANATVSYTSCNANAIRDGVCTADQKFLFLYQHQSDMLYPGNPDVHYTGMGAQLLRNSSDTFEYNPARKGIFCALVALVDIEGESFDYLDLSDPLFTMNAVNPYGQLPPMDYPRLPFYGLLSLTYLTIGLLWLIKSALHWNDILPVQNYIAGVLLFIMIDYAFQFGYYEHYNLNESRSKFLLGVCIILNAARVALSFFLVLIVSLGYGVVKPTLGSEMRKCQIMGAAVFICMTVFNVGLNSPAAQESPILALICTVPLSLSLSYINVRIINALKATIMHLELRRQTYKVSMYKWLRGILIVFFGVGLIMLVVSVSIKTGQYQDLFPWIITYMTSYWFFQDGWMSLLYLCAFLSIIVLWRPTANNARYGLEELPENAEQAYDLEMTPGFEADGQDIKRRTAASPDSESGHLHSPTGRAPQSATSPRQPPLKTGEVVFELSDNESPDDLIGGGGIMSNETRLSEVDLSGTNNRSAEEERRRKMDEISKLQ